MGLFWVPGRSGVRGNETDDELAKKGTVHQFAGPEPALGVSRQNISKKIKRWINNQHVAMWWGLTSTQGQARKMMSGPIPTAKTRLLSFNRIQSRVVTGLLNGNNTLIRHLYIMGLIDSPICRRCGAEEETAAHVLCKCEALVSLRHVYLASSFLDPEDVKSLSLGANWNLSKQTGLP